MMNKRFITQKTLKSKNINFFTLEELKQKLQQRKVHFAQLKLIQQKCKTNTKIQSKSSAFKNILIKNQKDIQGYITSRSPAKKPQNQQKSMKCLTERPQIPQKNIKNPSELLENDKQKSQTSRNDKIQQNFIVQKKKPIQVQQMKISKTIQTVADNFLSSFRIVFKELLESQFCKVFLQKQTCYLMSEIQIHFLKNINLQQLPKREILHQKQIETKMFLHTIHIMLQKQFTINQIQNMVNKQFPQRKSLVFADLEKLFNIENNLIDFLIERSYQKKFKQLSPTQLVIQLFKSLIETTDLQRKLRMICRANENQLVKFVMSISSGPMLKISSLALFLDEKDKQSLSGMKLTQAKVSKFLDKILSKKHTKFEFLKWLKMEDKFVR